MERLKADVIGSGLIAGVVTAFLVLSFTALVFSGPLIDARPLASILVLAVTAAMNLVMARATSLPGGVIGPQDTTSAVLAAALATTVVGLATDVALSTALAVIAIGSLATASVMLLLGGFRLGSVVRYIPYPVMGGFLAGTGVLLLTGAADLITRGYQWSTATTLSLAVGVVFGAVLLFASIRRLHALALPGLILAAIAVFYAGLAVSGISIDEARVLGLLDPSSGALGLPRVDLGPVDWGAVIQTIPALITIPIVAVVSLLLNVGGLELVSGMDADLDRELRGAGFANLTGAAGGTAAGYHFISLSAFGYRAGVADRAVTVVVALVCLVGAGVGPLLVSFLPVPVVGSLLVMLGFGFLYDWVIDGYRRMTQIEYLLMLVIAVGMVVLGFLIGIAFGLASAVLLFAATYSRLDPIRHSFTGSDRTSSVERSAHVRERLLERGDSIRVVEMEGFLFFGTAHTAARNVRKIVEPGVTRSLVIDLRRVQGLDSTAALAFAKLHRELAASGIELVVSNASSAIGDVLVRSGLAPSNGVAHMSDIDQALEYSEELVLGDSTEDPSNPWLLPEGYWQRLVPRMERIEMHAGDVLADLGEHERCVFVVESGRVAAEIPVVDGRWQRVRSAGEGGVLGEVALYGDGQRSARLTVVESGIALRLSPESVAELEVTDPACAIAFHRALARVLSERLVTSNDFIRALAR